MRSLLVVGLVIVAVAAAASFPSAQPVQGYHEAVGIPQAARIKEEEEKYFASHSDAVTQDGRIVGGSVAATNAHPYLGGLVITFVNVGGQSVCGSSLVSTNRLVTAAHCWFDGRYQARQFTVVLGSPRLFTGGTRIATSQVFMHSGWNPNTLANDIAMIYLPSRVTLSAAIQTIALPSTTETFAGLWGVASGYGRTSDQQSSVPSNTVVSEVRLQVITVAQCQAFFGVWARASNICTSGVGGVGICFGDSGGPLVITRNWQRILVGVSSFVGWGGCQAGYPSVYARITDFRTFINGHL